MLELKGLYYCNICHKLLSHIFFNKSMECRKCGILAHRLCRYNQRKLRLMRCKNTGIEMSSAEDGDDEQKQQRGRFRQPHKWVVGNLASESMCYLCETVCTSYHNLSGSKCCWCQRTKHDQCQRQSHQQAGADAEAEEDDECDMGMLKVVILPPKEFLFTHQKVTLNIQPPSQLHHKQLLLVIVNRYSGGQQGQ